MDREMYRRADKWMNRAKFMGYSTSAGVQKTKFTIMWIEILPISTLFPLAEINLQLSQSLNFVDDNASLQLKTCQQL